MKSADEIEKLVLKVHNYIQNGKWGLAEMLLAKELVDAHNSAIRSAAALIKSRGEKIVENGYGQGIREHYHEIEILKLLKP